MPAATQTLNRRRDLDIEPVDRRRGGDRLRRAGGRGLRLRGRRREADRLSFRLIPLPPPLPDGGRRLLVVGQSRLLATRRLRRVSRLEPLRHPGRPGLYALKSGYRQTLPRHERKTQRRCRQVQGRAGALPLQPPRGRGRPASLMAFPLVEAEDMPDIAVNEDALALRRLQAPISWSPGGRAHLALSVLGPSPTCCAIRRSASGGGVQDFGANQSPALSAEWSVQRVST